MPSDAHRELHLLHRNLLGVRPRARDIVQWGESHAISLSPAAIEQRKVFCMRIRRGYEVCQTGSSHEALAICLGFIGPFEQRHDRCKARTALILVLGARVYSQCLTAILLMNTLPAAVTPNAVIALSDQRADPAYGATFGVGSGKTHATCERQAEMLVEIERIELVCGGFQYVSRRGSSLGYSPAPTARVEIQCGLCLRAGERKLSFRCTFPRCARIPR